MQTQIPPGNEAEAAREDERDEDEIHERIRRVRHERAARPLPEEVKARVAERRDRMEEREPAPLQPTVIPREHRQQQERPEKLAAEREEQDEPQLQHDAAELRRRHGLLHRTALHETDLAPRGHRHGHRHRHDAEPADLDEDEQHELTEHRPVERRVLHREPRDAARGHRREERRQKRRALAALRGKRQHEQERSDRDERKKTQPDDLER